MFDLTNKTALVTGAASGIGESTARVLAEAGAFVYIADLNEAEGSRVAAEINSAGGKAEFVRLNVAERSECESAAEKVLAAHGRLDILVNNAGIGHVGTILATNSDDLDRLYAVNVRGVFVLT